VAVAALSLAFFPASKIMSDIEKKKEIKLNGKKPSSLAWFQSVY